MKHVITLILLASTATAMAGPKGMKPAGSGTHADGRAYDITQISCSGKKDPRQIIRFEGTKEWCLTDESLCSKSKMRTAKKACKKKV